jgi:cutinase
MTSPARFTLRAVHVGARQIGGLLGVVAVAMSAPLIAMVGIPSAFGACPDVEVVFARGTFEPPGVGGTGEAFVDSLRSHVGGKSLDVYPVNYPASFDFAAASDGVIDASNKVRDTVASCPNTKTVLGGYSQGAAVAAYLTADKVPDGFTPPAGITGPMPPTVANHVAPVVLFGKPSASFLTMIDNNAPHITIGHLYSGKTIDLCIREDPICAPGRRRRRSTHLVRDERYGGPSCGLRRTSTLLKWADPVDEAHRAKHVHIADVRSRRGLSTIG